MVKITKEKCIELLKEAACKKGHILEKKTDHAPWRSDVYQCKFCSHYAELSKSDFEGQVWMPWRGTLIDDKGVQWMADPIKIDSECWGAEWNIKELKEKQRVRTLAREEVLKHTNKLSRFEMDAIINALVIHVDFSEVPENDGSEKRDAWPHAIIERREAA